MRRGLQGQVRFLKSPSATLTPPFSGLLGEGLGVYSSGFHSDHRVILGNLFHLFEPRCSHLSMRDNGPVLARLPRRFHEKCPRE